MRWKDGGKGGTWWTSWWLGGPGGSNWPITYHIFEH